jgi:citrate synthase
MASRKERQEKYDAMSPAEQKQVLRSIDRYPFSSGSMIIGPGGPDEVAKASFEFMLCRADADPIFGKLLDNALGLVTDDERQLRASEDSARAANRSATASIIAAIAAVAAVLLGAILPRSCERRVEQPSATTVSTTSQATSHPTR